MCAHEGLLALIAEEVLMLSLDDKFEKMMVLTIDWYYKKIMTTQLTNTWEGHVWYLEGGNVINLLANVHWLRNQTIQSNPGVIPE